MKLKLKKIIDNKQSIINNREGYTIVELLAVLTILVIISGIIFGVIYSTLRGSSKIKATTQVSQQGEYVTGVISGIISDSRNVISINGHSLDDCTANPAPSSDNVTPTPAGYNPTIALKRIDGGTTTLSCFYMNGVYTIASSSGSTTISLLDNRSAQAADCQFTCTQLVSDPYSIPIVTANFKVESVFSGQTTNYFNAAVSQSLRVYAP